MFCISQRACLKKRVHNQLPSHPGSAELTQSPLAPCVTSHPLRDRTPPGLCRTNLDPRPAVSPQQGYSSIQSSRFLSFTCASQWHVDLNGALSLVKLEELKLSQSIVYSMGLLMMNRSIVYVSAAVEGLCSDSCDSWTVGWVNIPDTQSHTLFELRRSVALRMSCCIKGSSRKSPASCPRAAQWRRSAVHHRCPRMC